MKSTSKVKGQKSKVKSVVAASRRGFTFDFFVLTFAFCLAFVPARAADPSFANDVAPLLRDNCLACHNSAGKAGKLVMESYDSLMTGGEHGRPIVPGHAAESRIIQMLEGKIQPQMPMGGKLSPELIAILAKWIDAGAPGPAAGEAVALAAPVIPEIKPRVPIAPEIGSLAFSPDGKLLAAGSYKEVDLIDAATGKRLATLAGAADQIRSVAFSGDGKLVAGAGGLAARSGEVIVWSVESKQPVAKIQGHGDCIYGVAFSADGARIATASYDKLIKLWDAASGQETATLKDHIDAVWTLAFSPDGKRLASGAADRSVKIWDAATGQRVFTLSEPQDAVLTIAWHPSGKQIAAAGADKFIRVWDLTDKGGTVMHSTAAHEDSILKIAYSPDGKRLVSSSADRSIKVWDAATLEEQQLLHQPDWVLALAFSPDGKKLAAGRYDGSLSIYDAQSFQEVLKPMLAQKQ
jgi:WD40 repeat protein